MSQTTMSADELLNSLTGHDEIAIHAASGSSIPVLAEGQQTIMLRCLIAVHISRETGDPFPLAYRTAMGMPMGELTGYFAAEAADFDPDQPDSDVGKGSSPSD